MYFSLVTRETPQGYLNGQGLWWEAVLALVVSNGAMIGLTPLLLRHVGFVGAPVALALQRWIGVVVLLISVRLTKSYKPTWFGWSWDDALNWSSIKVFLKLGLPSCVSLMAEMLGYAIDPCIFLPVFSLSPVTLWCLTHFPSRRLRSSFTFASKRTLPIV